MREAAEKAAEAEVKLGLGEQIIEVREVDGQMMIYRTEGWLGGSPVTMVRKASDMDLVALGVSPPSETHIADLPKAASCSWETPDWFSRVTGMRTKPTLPTRAQTAASMQVPKP